MKLSRHNGRKGKDGAYKVNHNDRKFDLDNAEHINQDKAKANIYWDCYQGYYSELLIPREDGEIPAPFLDVEKLYYKEHYSEYCEKQSERNHKARHYDRDRSPEDLRKDVRTCPEESILQIGNKDGTVSPDVLVEVVEDYYKVFNEKFGDNIHIIDWSLHLDEATPHIHERHVFDSVNKYGEVQPQQEKTLELLGFELPEPDKPKGRKNNRKITFDKYCKSLLHQIAKNHGLILDTEPEFGNREYLEKQDYILMKQKEKIAAQEKRLEQLEITISDTESFVEKVSDVAYEKAKEVITDKVIEETHNMDFEIIADYKKSIVDSKTAKDNPKQTSLIARTLDGLMNKFKGFTERITRRLTQVLGDPVIKQEAKEPIKASILDELNRAKSEQAQREQNRGKTITKKRQRGSELE